MTEALHHSEVNGLIRRARSGDETALEQLYNLLRQKYLPRAMSSLKDLDGAETVLDEAFMKLQARLSDGFIWQGERAFYAYFRVILENEIHDWFRENKERLEWEIPSLDDTGEPLEYSEIAVRDDPVEEEALEQYHKKLATDLGDYYNTQLSPQERQFWEAYRALSEIPGSHKWGRNQKTAFLRKYLGLPKSAFYPAHTRFKQKLACFGLSRGWMRKEGKDHAT